MLLRIALNHLLHLRLYSAALTMAGGRIVYYDMYEANLDSSNVLATVERCHFFLSSVCCCNLDLLEFPKFEALTQLCGA